MTFCEEVYSHRWEADQLEAVRDVWKVLVEDFFQKLFGPDSTVLDIGCGFCHFLNNLKAREKVGVDANPKARAYAASDVKFHTTEDLTLQVLSSSYFDRVFISNFLEHLDSSKDVVALLARVHELLKPGGKVIILQPNFRLTGAAYYDFIDHKTVLTDKGVQEALEITGFQVEQKIVRFLPYTTKSKIPQRPFLVRLYLKTRPLWLLMGKQSLFVGLKPSGC